MQLTLLSSIVLCMSGLTARNFQRPEPLFSDTPLDSNAMSLVTTFLDYPPSAPEHKRAFKNLRLYIEHGHYLVQSDILSNSGLDLDFLPDMLGFLKETRDLGELLCNLGNFIKSMPLSSASSGPLDPRLYEQIKEHTNHDLSYYAKFPAYKVGFELGDILVQSIIGYLSKTKTLKQIKSTPCSPELNAFITKPLLFYLSDLSVMYPFLKGLCESVNKYDIEKEVAVIPQKHVAIFAKALFSIVKEVADPMLLICLDVGSEAANKYLETKKYIIGQIIFDCGSEIKKLS